MQTTAHYTAHYTAGKVNTLTVVRDEPRRTIAVLVVDDEVEARQIAAEVGAKFSTDPQPATGPSPEAVAAWRQLRDETPLRSYPTRVTDNRAAYRRKQLGLPPLQQTH
jgi:hypothetical protein